MGLCGTTPERLMQRDVLKDCETVISNLKIGIQTPPEKLRKLEKKIMTYFSIIEALGFIAEVNNLNKRIKYIKFKTRLKKIIIKILCQH